MTQAQLPTHQPLEHSVLRSAEGVSFFWNYSLFDGSPSLGCTSCNSPRYASPLTLTLRGVPDSAQNVRAVLLGRNESQIIDLRQVAINSSWTADFPFIAVADYGVRGSFVYDLQVAIVVDGRWLRDPISGTHNFTFSLDR